MDRLADRRTWMVGGVALSGASATALLPLRARAIDACQRLSVLRDAPSRELARRLGLGLTGLDARRVRAIASRSLVIDRWVREHLAHHPGGTVVEVGAGLSTRFERLGDRRGRWLEIDAAPIIELRRRYLPERLRRQHVVAGAVEHWLAHVASCPAPHCFVLEAVLAYLPGEQRSLLLSRLSRFCGATVVLDLPRRGSFAAEVEAALATSTCKLELEETVTLLGGRASFGEALANHSEPCRVRRYRVPSIAASAQP